MKMFGINREDLIPEVDVIVDAAIFLDIASQADTTLFI
jgi:peroxiredoxin family protein